MNKFGPALGITLCAVAILASAHLPASCSVTPEQQRTLQAYSVPAAGLLSKAAIAQGWLVPGDEITVQRGVAIVVSDDKKEAKLFKLAELGLDEAQRKGVFTPSDTVTLVTPEQAIITRAVSDVPPSPSALPVITPGELSAPLLPPSGG